MWPLSLILLVWAAHQVLAQTTRPFTPVVFQGSSLVEHLGQSVEGLHLYAWDNDTWRSIDFQMRDPKTEKRPLQGRFSQISERQTDL